MGTSVFCGLYNASCRLFNWFSCCGFNWTRISSTIILLLVLLFCFSFGLYIIESSFIRSLLILGLFIIVDSVSGSDLYNLGVIGLYNLGGIGL